MELTRDAMGLAKAKRQEVETQAFQRCVRVELMKKKIMDALSRG